MPVNTQVQDAVSQAIERALPQVREALQKAEGRAGPDEAGQIRAAAAGVDRAMAQLRTQLTEALSSEHLDVDHLVNSLVGVGGGAREGFTGLSGADGLDGEKLADQLTRSLRGTLQGNTVDSEALKRTLKAALRPGLNSVRAPMADTAKALHSHA
jgi:hypothetical protein